MSSVSDFIKEKQEINSPSKKEVKAEIQAYLMSEYYYEAHNKAEQLEQWFSGYLKNYIYKNQIEYKTENFENKLRHIVDYLGSSQAKRKFYSMTWDEAEKQTSKWDEWLKSRQAKGDDPNGTIVIHELSDGWKAVKLLSPKALSYEGATMQHCVGGYHNKVESGMIEIVSLRDKNDNSHITVEKQIINNKVIQVQGKQNKLPVKKHQAYFREFLKKSKADADALILKKMGVRKLGTEFVIAGTDDDYKKEVLKFFENNKNYQGGGEIDLSNIRGISHIVGKWDTINISNSDVEVVDVGSCQSLRALNANKLQSVQGGFKEIKISHAPLSEISDGFVGIDVQLYDCENLQTISGIVSNLKLKNSSTLSHLNSDNLLSLSIQGETALDVENLGVDSLELIGTSIVDLDLSKFKSLIMDANLSSSLSGIEMDDVGLWSIRSMPNLETVEDLNAPNLNIKIGNAPKLKSFNKNKLHHFSLSNCKSLNEVSKNQAYSMEVIVPNNRTIEMRRNRVKKVITNQVMSFRGKKKPRP